MKFGTYRLSKSEGLILAHGQRVGMGLIKKGTHLTEEHIGQLEAAGITEVMAAELEAGDVAEDIAAAALAKALAGPGVDLSKASTGRANLHSGTDGLALIDHDRIHRINMLDERMTVATLRPYTALVPRQLLATVKVISYAVPEFILERTIEVAERSGPCIDVASYNPKRAALILTKNSPADEKLLNKGEQATRERLARFDDKIALAETLTHGVEDLAAGLSKLDTDEIDLVFILSASAIVDRSDIVPSALKSAGGHITQLGMPVDPGNLLMLGTLGNADVVGIPGCARSTALNGFDWVLERLHAGLKVGTRDISRMGVGGLLKEIPSRPQLRDETSIATKDGEKPLNIQALVLAAGQSRRMGRKNKLLQDLSGKPVVAHVADAALTSGVKGVTIVTGHQKKSVEKALGDRALTFVNNPSFASGLSSSLRMGIASLPEETDGALICLGDMPFVSSEDLGEIIKAFEAAGPGSICIPTVHGKSGNPVLLPRSLFAEVLSLEGDVGAKGVIETHSESIVRVDLSSQAALTDIDTEAMLEEARNLGED